MTCMSFLNDNKPVRNIFPDCPLRNQMTCISFLNDIKPVRYIFSDCPLRKSDDLHKFFK